MGGYRRPHQPAAHVSLRPRNRCQEFDLSSFDILHAHGDDYWLWRPNKPAHIRTMHGSCLAEAIYVPGLINKARMLLLGLSEVLATVVADHTACVSKNTTTYYPWVKDVVVNGVDLAAFYPCGRKDIDPTILFVGTYRNRKRGHLLADAFGAGGSCPRFRTRDYGWCA